MDQLDEFKQYYILYNLYPSNKDISDKFFLLRDQLRQAATKIIHSYELQTGQRKEIEKNMVKVESQLGSSSFKEPDTHDPTQLATKYNTTLQDMIILYNSQLLANIGIFTGCLTLSVFSYRLYNY